MSITRSLREAVAPGPDRRRRPGASRLEKFGTRAFLTLVATFHDQVKQVVLDSPGQLLRHQAIRLHGGLRWGHVLLVPSPVPFQSALPRSNPEEPV